MVTTCMEDGNWSEKYVEVKEDLRTIECLRGRLLAERQASKVANEVAEQMGNKLIVLENLLKEEIKLRNKAEKKLRFLKKKLESLDISIHVDESEQSSSSPDNICAHSCKLSTTTSTSGLKDSEESESKLQIITPRVPQNPDNISSSNQSNESASNQENSSEHSSPSCKDSKPDDKNSVKAGMEADNGSDKEDYYVDNSLALVLVSNSIPAVKSESSEVKNIISSGNVRDALDALRLAGEMIQSSMESRHMIKVGHS